MLWGTKAGNIWKHAFWRHKMRANEFKIFFFWKFFLIAISWYVGTTIFYSYCQLMVLPVLKPDTCTGFYCRYASHGWWICAGSCQCGLRYQCSFVAITRNCFSCMGYASLILIQQYLTSTFMAGCVLLYRLQSSCTAKMFQLCIFHSVGIWQLLLLERRNLTVF